MKKEAGGFLASRCVWVRVFDSVRGLKDMGGTLFGKTLIYKLLPVGVGDSQTMIAPVRLSS